MQSQAPINDDGRDIVIPQIRFQENDNSKKMDVGSLILLGILFFGGGIAFVIARVASGSASVSFNDIPLGIVGGIIFLLGLLGYILFQYTPAIKTLFGTSQIEEVKPTNCIISMKGIILHDKDGNKYILKWKGIQSLASLKDKNGETYVAFQLLDRRYVAACKHTNSFISMKYSHQFDLTLPESSLPMSAKDFAKLLLQRAHLQGTQLAIHEMSEYLNFYVLVSSNPELDKLHAEMSERAETAGRSILGFVIAIFVIGLLIYAVSRYGSLAFIGFFILLAIAFYFALQPKKKKRKRKRPR